MGEKDLSISIISEEWSCEAGTFRDHELVLGHRTELPAKLLCGRPTCQTILPPNLRLTGTATLPPTCLQDVQGPCPSTKAAFSNQEEV